MVIGSVAGGRARDTSDLDLLLVLTDGSPRRSDYVWWDENVAPQLNAPDASRFAVEPLFIARTSVSTREPHLRRAIAGGLRLWHPEMVFG